MPLLPISLAAAAASVALVTDLRQRRIPNWLTLTALVAGLVVNLWLRGVAGGEQALVGAALGFAGLIPFYLMRAVGAGDVKLLAAVGALVGPAGLVSVAIYGGIVGGVMSVFLLAKHGQLSFTLQQALLMRMVPARSGIKAPYAVAIAGGVYLTLLPGFSALLTGA